jgi:D-xylose 1-dehydrogenase (NADP+, D-xylono-1,5-lactone-forming)
VSPSRHELELVGEDGVIVVRDPFTIHNPGIELRRGDESEQIPIEPTNSYRLELDNVSGAIAGDEDLLLGREDALGQARAIEALYASAEG